MRGTAAVSALLLMLLGRSPETASITVRSGEDLQQALNRASPGDTILLEPGAVYVGNFVLPSKPAGNGAYITIRSSAPDWKLPAANTRISPAHAEQLPKLR